VHAPSEVPVLEHGFLYDPESGFWNSNCEPLEAFFRAGACTALLGEPGSGKSWEMRRAAREAPDIALIDAGRDDPAAELRDPRLLQRLDDGRTIRIFVDGLDENARRSTNPVADVLRDIAGAFETLPLARISLCVACRTAAWTESAVRAIDALARALAAAHEEAGVAASRPEADAQAPFDRDEHAVPWLRVGVLAPLRLRDVELAAQEWGVAESDRARLVRELEDRDLGVLAARPLTLRLLIDGYLARKGLPSRAGEIMEQGCLELLSRGHSPERLARLGVEPCLSVSERMAVAKRIAAVSMLSGRPRIVVGAERGDAADAVSTAEIAGRTPTEHVEGRALVVEPRMVREVVMATALFEGDGRDYRWLHRALAEFLASRYLLEHGCTGPQILDLISYGPESDALVPQLEGVASWIDESFPENLRRQVIELDPVATLRGDLTARPDADKARIVKTLLGACEAGQWIELYDDNYRKLAHAGLAERLRPVLVDARRPLTVRRLSVQIAKRCKLADLSDELAGIALDGGEPMDLREDAAVAVQAMETSAARARLVDILKQPDDETSLDLRGVALDVAWQDGQLDARSLFELLTPGRPSYLGIYESVLYRLTDDLASKAARFDDETLLAGLAWARDEKTSRRRSKLASALLQAALQRLDRPDIVARVVEDIRQQLTEYKWLDWYLRHTDEAQRRALTAELLVRLPEDDLWSLAYRHFLAQNDSPWLLELMDAETDPARVRELAEILWCFGRENSSQVEELIERYHRDPERYTRFRSLVLCDLDSEEAAKLRKHHETQRKWQAKESASPPVSAWTEDDVAEALDAIEATDIEAWVKLAHSLWLNELDDSARVFWNRPVYESPGWQQADAARRSRIIAAASAYLTGTHLDERSWLGANELIPAAGAGLHALALLQTQAPDILTSLDMAHLARWVPALMGLSLPCIEPDVLDRLAERIKPHAHQAIERTIYLSLRGEDPQPEINLWHRWWIPELSDALATRLSREPLGNRAVKLSGFLLKHAPAEALPHIRRLLGLPAEDAESRAWLASLARQALLHAPMTFWPDVKERIGKSRELGRAILERASNVFDGARFVQAPWCAELPASELAWLCQWIHTQLPDEAALLKGPYVVSRIRTVLGAILGELRDRGTWEAVAALRELAKATPEGIDLSAVLAEAEHNARRKTWTPPQRDVILALADNTPDRPARRWILHSSRLRQAIIDAVNAWQPDRALLEQVWERVPGDAHRPVTEAALAGVLREHINRKLHEVAVPGEVKVQRLDGHRLRAEAGTDPGGFPVSVDIALVPSWADDPAAMLDTLGQRMSESGNRRYAVAILAWFGGHAWIRRSDHERRIRSLGRDRDATQAQLARHAQSIESERDLGIAVAMLDLCLDEQDSDFCAALPWGRDLLDRLGQEEITPCSFTSMGDDRHWHVRLRWPEHLSDRFGLAPESLLLACTGLVTGADLERAQDEIRVAGANMDPELLVVVDDQPELARRLERLPGQVGQWVPWPAPAFPDLRGQMSQTLRGFDVFDIGYPVRGRQFMGREHEVADLGRRILRGESVAIFGLRRSGKTSLARAVTDTLDPMSAALSMSEQAPVLAEARPRVVAVWLDVQGVAERTEPALWRALARNMRQRLHASRGEAEPGPDEHEQELDIHAELAQLLRAALEHENGRGRLCIVLDEYDLLFEGAGGEAGIPCSRLLGLLRGLSQETGRLSTVLIGRDSRFLDTPEIEGLSNPLLGWVTPHWIEPLAPGSADELLIRLGKRAGLDVGPASLVRAQSWSGRHVTLLRQFGAALLQAASDLFPDREIMPADQVPLEDALERFLDRDRVRQVRRETFQLLETRYGTSYELLMALVACDSAESMKAAIRAHGGWLADAARVLRKFGLLAGSSRAPELPRWLVWSGRLHQGLATDELLEDIDGEPDQVPPGAVGEQAR
jgi:hypothetical protein